MYSSSLLVGLLIITLVNIIKSKELNNNIPKEWQDKINNYNAFYTNDDSFPIDATTGYPMNLYLPTLGNGYVAHGAGIRGDTLFISGLFNNETTNPSHRASIPTTFNISIDNVTPLGALNDVLDATYYRRGIVNNVNHKDDWYELKWYAHRSLKSLYVMELEIIKSPSSQNVTLDIINCNRDKISDNIDDIKWFLKEIINDMSIDCGDTTISEAPNGPVFRICVASTIIPNQLIVDKTTKFTYITAIQTSLEMSIDEVYSSTINDYQNGILSSSILHLLHIQAWDDLYISGIEIEGRPDVAMAINSSLYSILSSVRGDWNYGLAPGGLTNSYNGHSFWDTETWMYPPLLNLQPSISQSLIKYRFDRLDGARQKAKSYNPPFSGTMFPWESAYSGLETCPTFASTGLREDHISGDIAFAVWQEYCARGDLNWLREIGYPILSGVSEFWMSIATYKTDANGVASAHINNIIPPDEYADHKDDSVYTNFIAIQSLKYTVQAANLLNINCEECNSYTKLSNDLVILFDSDLGIHPEYYNYRGQKIKQADVVMLHYPLGMEMTNEIHKADLDYYSSRTDSNGPAMTWGMHSIGYNELGEYTTADKFFNMSFQDNIQQPLHVWSETPNGNAANFITGAGGFLQSVLSGYFGFRLTVDNLSFTPICIEHSTYLKVRSFDYMNMKFNFEYWCDNTISATDRNPYQTKITLLSSVTDTIYSLSGNNMIYEMKMNEPIIIILQKEVTPFTFIISKI